MRNTSFIKQAIAASTLIFGMSFSASAQTDYWDAGRFMLTDGYGCGIWKDTGFVGWSGVRNYQTRQFDFLWDQQGYSALMEYGKYEFGSRNVDSLYKDAIAWHKHTGENWSPTGAGGAYTGMYGWLWLNDNENVEWYIIEDWFGNRPDFPAQKVGTTNQNGGTYDMYHVPKYAFGSWPIWNQWWSVRQNKQLEGSISYVQHFMNWRARGMANLPLVRATFMAEPSTNPSTGKFAYNWITIYDP